MDVEKNLDWSWFGTSQPTFFCRRCRYKVELVEFMCPNMYDHALRANFLGNRRGSTVVLIKICFIISFSFFLLDFYSQCVPGNYQDSWGLNTHFFPIYFDLEYLSAPKMANRIRAFLSIIINYIHWLASFKQNCW